MFKILKPEAITFDQVSGWFKGDLRPLLSGSLEPSGVTGQVTISSGVPVGKSPEQLLRLIGNEYAVNLAFYNGDHWQNASQWGGQFPYKEGSTTELDDQALNRIHRSLVSENMIAEVTDRHNSAVVGRSPASRIYTPEELRRQIAEDTDPPEPEKEGQNPVEPEPDPVEERQESFAKWMLRRDVLKTLQEYGRTLLLGETASLRIYIPAGLIARLSGKDEIKPGDRLTVPTQKSYDDALKLIRLEVVQPGEGGVYEDPNTGDRYSAVIRKTTDGKRYAEVAYLDDQGNTVIMLVSEEGGQPIKGTGINLGGHLPIYTRRRRPLITEQIRSLQRMLNKALTMANVNLDWAGFLERIVLNGQSPMIEVDGKKVARWNAGPGTATFITGIVQTDADDKESVATPQVVFREPIKVDAFEGAVGLARRSILHEAFQMHALISGDAAPSGESRRQAMADFLISLLLTKPHLDAVGLWLVDIVDHYAMALCGKKVEDSTRYSFRTRLDPGPLSPEDVTAIVAKVKDRLISQRTALQELRYEDVEAELAAIEAETYANAGRLADLVKKLTDAGFSLEGALRYMKVPEDVIKQILSFTGASGADEEDPEGNTRRQPPVPQRRAA